MNIFHIIIDKYCIISEKDNKFQYEEYKPEKKGQFYLCEDETEDVVIEVKKAMKKLLPQIKKSDIMVASSNDAKKHSYHIVLDRWCVANNEEAKAIFDEILNLIPEKYRGALDNKMYKSLQQFRMYNSHKFESMRVKDFCPQLSSWKPDLPHKDDKHLTLLILKSFILSNISDCSFLQSFVKEKINSFRNQRQPSSKAQYLRC